MFLSFVEQIDIGIKSAYASPTFLDRDRMSVEKKRK